MLERVIESTKWIWISAVVVKRHDGLSGLRCIKLQSHGVLYEFRVVEHDEMLLDSIIELTGSILVR